MTVFSIDLTKVSDWEKFNNLMVDLQNEHVQLAESEAEKLGISYDLASDIIYLRSRSRWTFDKEQKLIELGKRGIRPNIMDWDGEDV
jgi:hypothetical protein